MTKQQIYYVLTTLILVGLGSTLISIYISKNPEIILDRALKLQVANSSPQVELLEDKLGITVFTVGTSTPLPSERAQTCTAVFVNGHFFVFDLGYGSLGQMERMQLPLADLDGIFLTHWHTDHYIDLPYTINRSWQLGRKKELHVYAPEGVDTVIKSIEGLLSIENQHRVDHHGPEIMDTKYSSAIPHAILMEKNGSRVVYEKDDIKITAFDVCHEPVTPDFGYKIEYNEKVLVISGDTKKCDNIIKHAKGADLLIHEALLVEVIEKISVLQEEIGNARNSKILHDILDYHVSPKQAAEIAQEAGVKELVLNHLGPAPDNFVIKRLFEKDVRWTFDGKIHIAEDGNRFDIK